MLSSSCRIIYTRVFPTKTKASAIRQTCGRQGSTTHTITSFGSAGVMRLSSQYSHPPRDEMNAVSVNLVSDHPTPPQQRSTHSDHCSKYRNGSSRRTDHIGMVEPALEDHPMGVLVHRQHRVATAAACSSSSPSPSMGNRRTSRSSP